MPKRKSQSDLPAVEVQEPAEVPPGEPVPVSKAEWEQAVAASDLPLSRVGFMLKLIINNCDYATGTRVQIGPVLQSEKHIPYRTAYGHIKWLIANKWLTAESGRSTYRLSLPNFADLPARPAKDQRSSAKDQRNPAKDQRSSAKDQRNPAKDGTSNELEDLSRPKGVTRASKTTSSPTPPPDGVVSGSSESRRDRTVRELGDFLQRKSKGDYQPDYDDDSGFQLRVRDLLSRASKAGMKRDDLWAAIEAAWESHTRTGIIGSYFDDLSRRIRDFAGDN